MTNPVLAKSKVFSPTFVAPSENTPPATYWQPPSGQQTPGQPPSGQQTPWQPQSTPEPAWQIPGPPSTVHKVMTLDDVLTKTALTVGLTILVAIGSAWLTIALNLTLSILYAAGIICGLATIIFPFIAAARRKVGPGIALAFAVLEGVFLGAISLIFELAFPGIVIQAVLATFIAAGLTLAGFKFGNFRLSSKMRKIVMMSMIGFVVVALLNLGLRFLGLNLGLFPGPGEPVSWLAWLFAGLGVVLAVLSLVDDFQYIEYGIANKIPATESWRAAYGLTVTLVWLYINLLRILSYIRR